jgi:hypothetical protein
METLNLSGTTPRAENRLKSLFWPSIETSSDVDYLGGQGYWVCAIVGVWSLITAAIQGHPVAGAFILLFYYFGGVGVRQRSRYAAMMVLVMFVTDFVAGVAIAGVVGIGPGAGVFRLLLTALLLSNLRATWIASQWKPGSTEGESPLRFGETWTDKFVDLIPRWLWPKIRILYYIFSVAYLFMVAVGLAILVSRGRR